MIFDYVERKTRRGDSIWSAFAPVTILGGSITPPRHPWLVDTGCDRTHIPMTLGAQMFDISDCDEHLMTWGDDHETTVFAPRVDVYAALDELTLVTIRPVIGDFGKPMLGMDFLAHFRATFDGRARQLTLEFG
jgi:hypothetical protein